MKKIMMLAGEPSGDLHGSNLALELKRNSSGIEIFGTGGEKMKNAGVNILFDLKDLAITGLLDVIKNYFRLKKIQRMLLSHVIMDSRFPRFSAYGGKAGIQKIDLIILIDYPDFNLRFAKKAQRFGVPIIYYITPQVWAWRKGRIKLIKKYVKKNFVILKFEEELYKKEGVPVEFIGHPLLDIVKSQLTKEEFLKTLSGDRRPKGVPRSPERSEGSEAEGRPATKGGPAKSRAERGERSRGAIGDQIIALLPGSRNRLVRTLLPIMLESAKLIHEKSPGIKFLISKAPSVNMSVYENDLNKYDLPISLVEGKPYEIINASDFVLTVSGTSTLETAILERPMAIIYKLPLSEYFLAKPLLRLKNIGLVNIVAGEEIVPEFIQFKARPKKIAKAVIDILTNKERYENIKNKLSAVKTNLYPDGASKKAALSILKFLG